MKSHTQIACIGVGYWGKNLLRNFHAMGNLTAVCELDSSRKSEVERLAPGVPFTADLEEILSNRELSGVAVATPAETHGEIVRRALEAGKDVLVEKPLCLSASEGRKLVDLAQRRRRILMVGHLLWYHPAILKMKELIDAGELGRIEYIYSNRLNLGKIRREENILWSFAPHDVSIILGLVGEMPDEVDAKGANYLHNGIADVTVSWMSFPSGVKAHIFVSWLHPFKEQRLVVVGDRKMAVFDDMQVDQKLLLYPHKLSWKNHLPVAQKAAAEVVPFEMVEPLRSECEHFVKCIETRQHPRTEGEEGLRVLRVLEACQGALETRAPHYLEQRRAKTDFFVHESAFLDEDVEVGSGTTIWHVSHVLKNSRIGKKCRIGQNVVIGPNVSIGDDVKIQNNVSVYEGVQLEDHVFCGPSMVFTNVINPRSEIKRMNELRPTLVKRGATLGANCTVVCGVTIGEYAFVGAGAVVTRDVPPFALIVGNPGVQKGWMCRCGVRLHFKGEGEGECNDCHASYRLVDGAVIPVSDSVQSTLKTQKEVVAL